MRKAVFVLLITFLTVLTSCQQKNRTQAAVDSSDYHFSESAAGEYLSDMAGKIPSQDQTTSELASSKKTASSEKSNPSTVSTENTNSQCSSAAKPDVPSSPTRPPHSTNSQPTASKPPVSSSGTSSTGKVSSIPESSKPEPPSSKPEPPEEKDPYSYPFDIEGIKKDLIKYGESLGMKHRTVTEERYYDATTGAWVEAGTPITPENSSWWGGYILSYTEYPNPEFDKRQLYDYVKFDHDTFHMTSFTIYAEPLNDGAYQIYVLR